MTLQTIGLVASIVLPFWNIPLILNIVNRRSSKDVSLSWAVGVWSCLLLMLPSGLVSKDVVWKTFCVVNFMLFSGVVASCICSPSKQSQVANNSRSTWLRHVSG